ncbi:MAG: SDR family oxidoreductase [Phycisphaerales bacterium]|nr:SDR family oxidoreductase [Phycisphaerales bacterium]
MSQPVCIVSGASRGIGLAVARRFINAGHIVCGVARHEDALLKASRGLDAGERFVGLVGDVSKPADVERVVAAAAERGAIRALINNAGCAPLSPVSLMNDEDFQVAIDVNVAGVFFMTRAVWPAMLTNGDGVIVNISSVASIDPFPGFAVYGACKAWVNLFTQAVAGEGKPHGIRVYAVAPGAVETAMLRAHFPDLPTENTLDPNDVAAVVEQCCGEAMAHCSGQTIFVRR